MSKSRQNSNTPNRLSVADRTALLAKVGTREGEMVLQADIGLTYTWTDTQGYPSTERGGIITYLGLAKYVKET